MIASVAVGRNAARPNAIGNWAKRTKAPPKDKRLDKPSRRLPMPKQNRLTLKPKTKFFSPIHFPIGHCMKTSKISWIAISALLQPSLNAGLLIPPFTRSIGRALCIRDSIPVASKLINRIGINGLNNLIF